MKSIAIVSDFRVNNVVQTIEENLRMVFMNYVKINNYYICELKEGDLIKDDVILIMLENRLLKIKPFVDDLKKIIVVERTIKETEAYKIFQIPEKTKVLVVNDCDETIHQLISLLYQIGINHLTLVPYNSEERDESIKIAITPGEAHLVPSYIENIMDVGNRWLDAYTLIRIKNMLAIDNSDISSNLVKYFNQIMDINIGIKEQYKDVYVKNELLSTIMQQSGEGILIVDNNYSILYSNKKFEQLFNISCIDNSKALKNVVDKSVYKFLINKSIKDELLIVGNESTLVSKSELKYFNEKSGYHFNFRSVTYIKELEQNMSYKLREKGLVAKYTFEDIIFKSDTMRECIDLGKKISKTDFTVLITGESGTGKELFAQSIHNYSQRAHRPFIAINCAAMPESLLESELFGYEGGSFTGAKKEGKLGVFELAQHGTIFLDEIGDMPLLLQAKLLRVIQERQVMPVGSERVIDVDVRIIAATNKDLSKMVIEGSFREDLYYRIRVIPISIPPLRQRKEDIVDLFKGFIGRDREYLTKDMEERLISYKWPGNVRELNNVSDYFKIMKTIDENIVPVQEKEINVDLFDEFISISKYINEKQCYALLDILYKYTVKNIGVGRKILLENIKSRNLNISESRLRTVINQLSKQELIISSIGRGGTKITAKGIEFRKWLINRLR